MEPLISVIVPVYKVELYLRQCVDSLLAQTYSNLEIILVDDGSPDNCPLICDEYARKDSRIRVIHKENGGLSDARNVGIAAARGEYIGFIDSDDWVMPDMYEYLYNGMQQYGADITVCEYYEVWAKKYRATYRPEVRIFEGSDVVNAILMLKVGSYAWNKLYKRELWGDEIRYPAGKLYEDVRTTYRVFENAKLVAALPEPKYFYRRTGESITSNNSIRNKAQSVEARIERFERIADQYPASRDFMLKDMYRFTPDLRKAIVNNSPEEYQRYQDEVQAVSDFLRQHEEEACRAMNLGPFGRMSYRCMAKGGRNNWRLSVLMEKLVIWKADFTKKKRIKKILDFLRSWKSSEIKRYYYKVCCKMPIREAAFVESRGGEDLAGNMFEAARELCARGIKVYLCAKPNKLEKVRSILKTGEFPGVEVVVKWTKPYYKALATTRYWFNDMVFEDVIVKRPGQIYVNTWHGTPLKTLEFDISGQRHNIGGSTRDFLKTDYFAVPSKFLFDKLLTSNSVDTVFRGKALYCGYPRNSVFFDEQKRAEVRTALGLDQKEVFVYMPTWRGNLLTHTAASGEYATDKIMDFFEQTLKDNQIMLMKLHNYAAESVDYKKYTKVCPFPDEFDAYSVLNVADCLITDYSSVFFDFANTGKKVVLFTHDRDEYLRDRGLYMDLDDLPFPKAQNYEEMAAQLNIVKDYDDSEFIRTYCGYDCADSARKMIDYLLGDETACLSETAPGNGKKNILLYDSEIEKRAALAPNEDPLKDLDPEEANYFYCYPQWRLKATPAFLRDMRPGFRMLTLTKEPVTLWTEKIAKKLTGRKTVRGQWTREKNRQIYGDVFDEVRVLGSNEYDPFYHIVSNFKK